MRKIFVLFLAVLFLSGCAGITSIHISDDASTAAGTAIGVFVKVKYPDIAKQAIPYAQGLLAAAKSGTVSTAMLEPAVDSLLTSCKADPALKALIDTTVALVSIQVQTGTVNTNLIDALNGFITGISS